MSSAPFVLPCLLRLHAHASSISRPSRGLTSAAFYAGSYKLPSRPSKHSVQAKLFITCSGRLRESTHAAGCITSNMHCHVVSAIRPSFAHNLLMDALAANGSIFGCTIPTLQFSWNEHEASKGWASSSPLPLLQRLFVHFHCIPFPFLEAFQLAV